MSPTLRVPRRPLIGRQICDNLVAILRTKPASTSMTHLRHKWSIQSARRSLLSCSLSCCALLSIQHMVTDTPFLFLSIRSIVAQIALHSRRFFYIHIMLLHENQTPSLLVSSILLAYFPKQSTLPVEQWSRPQRSNASLPDLIIPIQQQSSSTTSTAIRV